MGQKEGLLLLFVARGVAPGQAHVNLRWDGGTSVGGIGPAPFVTVGERRLRESKSNLNLGVGLIEAIPPFPKEAFMGKHVLPNRPPTAFDGDTGMRLAPPGLLQVDRWKHLTEKPVAATARPAPAKTSEDS